MKYIINITVAFDTTKHFLMLMDNVDISVKPSDFLLVEYK